ncbi:Os05g0572800, partial [Oryza sativa Japonica Group]
VPAAARDGELGEERRGVGGRAAGDGLREHGGRAAVEAVPGDLARHLVGHHVPQPVARQDQELVLVRPLHHPHLRLCAHERLQVVVA